ncbi:MAG TPA: OmpA family protein [Pseudomonadota bacterium]|nr:OmpA family protein [Pseudomonadota bacterium]
MFGFFSKVLRSRAVRAGLFVCGSAVTCGIGVSARAQDANRTGFQLNRYEPALAGSWGFAVDHPWFSKTRYFAVGLTGNYGYQPLKIRQVSADGLVLRDDAVIAHQLVGHLDLAGSFLDRVNVSLSWPVSVYEQGQAGLGVAPAFPTFGDPRVGVLVRVFGQPDESPVSLTVGGAVWVPLRSFVESDLLPSHSGDSTVRGLPKLVLAGYASRIRWAVSAGVMIRPSATLGTPDIPDGATAGYEAQVGALLQYADKERRFSIGPELLYAGALSQNTDRAQNHNALEVLLGAQYNLANTLQVGLAGGLGLFSLPGTPTARALLRIAYAPLPEKKVKLAEDRDHDGTQDAEDLCPDEPAGPHPDANRLGCPLLDQDHDGVLDREDQCPTVPAGRRADPNRLGCPLADKDGDGVSDSEDVCPEVAMGDKPDPRKLGCPQNDRDADGIDDAEDQCPDIAQGAHPSPTQKGCPDKDTDGDSVFDAVDQCKELPQGLSPDPKRPGCPALDFDGDTVPDDTDACPERPGVPSSDPRKNGCPGLVALSGGTIKLSQQVFFKFNRDGIQKASFPLLRAVADLLKARPELKRIEIQGHTDNRGPADYNLDLSDRRAKAVMQHLVEQGVDATRLAAKGYGDTQPLGNNNTVRGRLQNRRVAFVVVDPPLPAAVAPQKLPKRLRRVKPPAAQPAPVKKKSKKAN